MGSRNGEVKFKIQPPLFLRFRVGLESDEGEQYHYEHGYDTLI